MSDENILPTVVDDNDACKSPSKKDSSPVQNLSKQFQVLNLGEDYDSKNKKNNFLSSPLKSIENVTSQSHNSPSNVLVAGLSPLFPGVQRGGSNCDIFEGISDIANDFQSDIDTFLRNAEETSESWKNPFENYFIMPSSNPVSNCQRNDLFASTSEIEESTKQTFTCVEETSGGLMLKIATPYKTKTVPLRGLDLEETDFEKKRDILLQSDKKLHKQKDSELKMKRGRSLEALMDQASKCFEILPTNDELTEMPVTLESTNENAKIMNANMEETFPEFISNVMEPSSSKVNEDAHSIPPSHTISSWDIDNEFKQIAESIEKAFEMPTKTLFSKFSKIKEINENEIGCGIDSNECEEPNGTAGKKQVTFASCDQIIDRSPDYGDDCSRIGNELNFEQMKAGSVKPPLREMREISFTSEQIQVEQDLIPKNSCPIVHVDTAAWRSEPSEPDDSFISESDSDHTEDFLSLDSTNVEMEEEFSNFNHTIPTPLILKTQLMKLGNASLNGSPITFGSHLNASIFSPEMNENSVTVLAESDSDLSDDFESVNSTVSKVEDIQDENIPSDCSTIFSPTSSHRVSEEEKLDSSRNATFCLDKEIGEVEEQYCFTSLTMNCALDTNWDGLGEMDEESNETTMQNSTPAEHDTGGNKELELIEHEIRRPEEEQYCPSMNFVLDANWDGLGEMDEEPNKTKMQNSTHISSGGSVSRDFEYREAEGIVNEITLQNEFINIRNGSSDIVDCSLEELESDFLAAEQNTVDEARVDDASINQERSDFLEDSGEKASSEMEFLLQNVDAEIPVELGKIDSDTVAVNDSSLNVTCILSGVDKTSIIPCNSTSDKSKSDLSNVIQNGSDDDGMFGYVNYQKEENQGTALDRKKDVEDCADETRIRDDEEIDSENIPNNNFTKVTNELRQIVSEASTTASSQPEQNQSVTSDVIQNRVHESCLMKTSSYEESLDFAPELKKEMSVEATDNNKVEDDRLIDAEESLINEDVHEASTFTPDWFMSNGKKSNSPVQNEIDQTRIVDIPANEKIPECVGIATGETYENALDNYEGTDKNEVEKLQLTCTEELRSEVFAKTDIGVIEEKVTMIAQAESYYPSSNKNELDCSEAISSNLEESMPVDVSINAGVFEYSNNSNDQGAVESVSDINNDIENEIIQIESVSDPLERQHQVDETSFPDLSTIEPTFELGYYSEKKTNATTIPDVVGDEIIGRLVVDVEVDSEIGNESAVIVTDVLSDITNQTAQFAPPTSNVRNKFDQSQVVNITANDGLCEFGIDSLEEKSPLSITNTYTDSVENEACKADHIYATKINYDFMSTTNTFSNVSNDNSPVALSDSSVSPNRFDVTRIISSPSLQKKGEFVSHCNAEETFEAVSNMNEDTTTNKADETSPVDIAEINSESVIHNNFMDVTTAFNVAEGALCSIMLPGNESDSTYLLHEPDNIPVVCTPAIEDTPEFANYLKGGETLQTSSVTEDIHRNETAEAKFINFEKTNSAVLPNNIDGDGVSQDARGLTMSDVDESDSSCVSQNELDETRIVCELRKKEMHDSEREMSQARFHLNKTTVENEDADFEVIDSETVVRDNFVNMTSVFTNALEMLPPYSVLKEDELVQSKMSESELIHASIDEETNEFITGTKSEESQPVVSPALQGAFGVEVNDTVRKNSLTIAAQMLRDVTSHSLLRKKSLYSKSDENLSDSQGNVRGTVDETRLVDKFGCEGSLESVSDLNDEKSVTLLETRMGVQETMIQKEEELRCEVAAEDDLIKVTNVFNTLNLTSPIEPCHSSNEKYSGSPDVLTKVNEGRLINTSTGKEAFEFVHCVKEQESVAFVSDVCERTASNEPADTHFINTSDGESSGPIIDEPSTSKSSEIDKTEENVSTDTRNIDARMETIVPVEIECNYETEPLNKTTNSMNNSVLGNCTISMELSQNCVEKEETGLPQRCSTPSVSVATPVSYPPDQILETPRILSSKLSANAAKVRENLDKLLTPFRKNMSRLCTPSTSSNCEDDVSMPLFVLEECTESDKTRFVVEVPTNLLDMSVAALDNMLSVPDTGHDERPINDVVSNIKSESSEECEKIENLIKQSEDDRKKITELIDMDEKLLSISSSLYFNETELKKALAQAEDNLRIQMNKYEMLKDYANRYICEMNEEFGHLENELESSKEKCRNLEKKCGNLEEKCEYLEAEVESSILKIENLVVELNKLKECQSLESKPQIIRKKK